MSRVFSFAFLTAVYLLMLFAVGGCAPASGGGCDGAVAVGIAFVVGLSVCAVAIVVMVGLIRLKQIEYENADEEDGEEGGRERPAIGWWGMYDPESGRFRGVTSQVEDDRYAKAGRWLIPIGESDFKEWIAADNPAIADQRLRAKYAHWVPVPPDHK